MVRTAVVVPFGAVELLLLDPLAVLDDEVLDVPAIGCPVAMSIAGPWSAKYCGAASGALHVKPPPGTVL